MPDELNPEEKEPMDHSEDLPGHTPELTEIDILTAKVTELEQNVAQLKDQLLRKAAEFENYKRRMENDYASIIKYSNEELILKILPVLDDFDRSFKARKDEKKPADAEKFREGVELIYAKFVKVLEKLGVKHLEVVGKPFDPQYHDALLQIPKKGVPPHTVVEEVDKGYSLNEKVIRHARVIVSTDEPVATGAQDESDDHEGIGVK